MSAIALARRAKRRAQRKRTNIKSLSGYREVIGGTMNGATARYIAPDFAFRPLSLD